MDSAETEGGTAAVEDPFDAMRGLFTREGKGLIEVHLRPGERKSSGVGGRKLCVERTAHDGEGGFVGWGPKIGKFSAPDPSVARPVDLPQCEGRTVDGEVHWAVSVLHSGRGGPRLKGRRCVCKMLERDLTSRPL